MTAGQAGRWRIVRPGGAAALDSRRAMAYPRRGAGEWRSDAMTAFVVTVAAADWVSGVYLLFTARHRRHPGLGERLAPFGPTPLADEVEEWLRRQSQGRPG